MNTAAMNRHAFTLVELLVALSIFMALMMIGSMAFVSFDRTAEEARQSLAIHSRAESLERFLRDRLNRIPAFTGLRLVGPADADEAPALTFMYASFIPGAQFSGYVSRDRLNRFGTVSGGVGNWDELCWGHLEWRDDGILRFARSRPPTEYNDLVYGGLYSGSKTYSFHRNHRIATPQRQICHLIGLSDVAQKPGQPWRRYGIFDAYDRNTAPFMYLGDFDGDGDYLDSYAGEGGALPWLGRVIAYGFFGTKTVVNNAFAVVNEDGRLFNKDWINLVGVPDSNQYPDQRRPAFDHIECFELIPIDISGDPITVEDDCMRDGAESLDWTGRLWAGPDSNPRRPVAFECRVLIHDLPDDRLDDGDEDGDGDFDEPLAGGLRGRFSGDGTIAGERDRRLAIQARLAELGCASQIFCFTINIPH